MTKKRAEEAAEEEKAIKDRDYEIYVRISYKAMERKYEMKEMQPVGRETVDRVQKETEGATRGTEVEWIKQGEETWNDWKQRKRYMKKYEDLYT